MNNKLVMLPAFMSLVLVLADCSVPSQAQEMREDRIKKSAQYKDGKFQNPFETPMTTEGSTWDLMKRYTIVPRIDPAPKGEIPVTYLNHLDWNGSDSVDLQFSWLGHSSILIRLEDKNILLDPVLENRASPVSFAGPKRFHPAPVTANELPSIDIVLITHDHYDHLEKPTMEALADKAGLFIAPLGIGTLLEKWGVPPEKVIDLDWWEHHMVDSLTITVTPAFHYASRGLFDRNKRLWCSYAINGKERSIFISGDGGYYDEFKKVGEELGPFDMSFLKIGSYDETWKQIHMTPEGAIQQHLDVQAKVLVPLHWATFDLALHPWYEPMERLITDAEKHDVQFLTPRIGQKIMHNQLPDLDHWWREVDKE